MDAVFGQLYGATVGVLDGIAELTEREKVFLRVTAAVCDASLGAGFAEVVRAGADAGVSTADVRALLRFVAYDSGYHLAADAIRRLAEVEAELRIDAPEGEPLAAELLAVGAVSPLPAEVRATVAALDEQYLEYFDLQSRMRSGHEAGTLSERERGLVSLSVDMHYQTLEETFCTHIARALRGGGTRETVRAALRFNAQFGVTRAWQAWKALNAYFAELDRAA